MKLNFKAVTYIIVAIFVVTALGAVLLNLKKSQDTRSKAAEGQNTGGEQITDVEFPSTEYLVKLKPTVTAQGQVSTQVFNPQGRGVPAIDRISREHPVKSFEKVATPNKNSKADAEVFKWHKLTLQGEEKTLKAKQVITTDEKTQITHVDVSYLEVLEKLKSDPTVESVEPNFHVEHFKTPNDTYMNSTGAWGQSFPDMWGLKKINAEAGWDVSTGSASIIIANIDTGLDFGHEDLVGNIWENVAEKNGLPGVDDDQNGYIDDVRGWNFFAKNNNPTDDVGHGTHTIGTIGAVANNGKGVAGLNWSTKIMVLKFLGPAGGDSVGGAKALQYAADNGARVSSNSWGCSCQSQMVEDAVRYEHEKGMVAVVAAGNSNWDALDFSPASADYAITVGASDPNDVRAAFSNFGSKIDVVAPGVDILSLRAAGTDMYNNGKQFVPNNDPTAKYYRSNGTSMATPHVSGLAALLLSKNPALTNEEIRQIIRTTSVDLGTSGKDSDFGYGRINAAAALAQASSQPLAPIITSPQSRGKLNGSAGQIFGRVTGANFANYKIEVGLGNSPSSWTTLANSSTPVPATGVLATVDTTKLVNGIYTIRLTAVSNSNKIFKFEVYTVLVENYPFLKSGFPIILPITSGPYRPGAAISPLVANIDADPQLEIVKTVLYGGPIYAWNYDSTPVSGWFPGGRPGNANITIGNFILGNTFNEVFGAHRNTSFAFGDTVSFYASLGSSLTGWPKNLLTGQYILWPGAAADLDNDGVDEVVVGHSKDQSYCWKPDGSNCVGWPKSNPGADAQFAIADLDNDGKLEVVSVSWATVENSIYLRAYTNTGTTLSGFPITIKSGQSETYPVIGDVDGDGNQEIIVGFMDGVSSERSIVRVFSSSGQIKRDIIVDDRFSQISPALGDLTGDGVPEIVIQMDKKIYAFRGDGSAVSGWPQVYSTFTTAFQNNSAPTIGDIDGDGQVDVAVVKPKEPSADEENHTGEVMVYNKNGTMLSGFPIKILQLGKGSMPVIADIDLDGRNELIVTTDFSDITNKLYVFDLKGLGPYGPVEWGQFGGGPKHQNVYVSKTKPPICQMGYTVKVVHGPNGAAGTAGNKINLDAIIENGVTRETTTAGFTPTPIGNWTSNQNPAMSGGSDMRSSVRGDTLTFTTLAKELTLVHSKGAGHVIAQVFADNAPVKSFDQYSPTGLYQQKFVVTLPATGKTQICDTSAFAPKNLTVKNPSETRRPELTWDSVSGITTYRVEISPNGTVWQTVNGTILKTIPGTPEKTVWVPSSDLPTSKTTNPALTGPPVHMRAYAVHPQYGVSTPSNEVTSYIPRTPATPSTPTVVASGQTNIAPYLLRWTKVPSSGLDPQPKSYHIQIATDTKFETVVSDVKGYVPQSPYQTTTTVSYPVPSNSLKSATTYYWRVRAQATDGLIPTIPTYPVFSNWLATGAVFKSKLDIAVPVLPTNGTIVTTLKPTFKWKEVPQATTYTFQTAPVIAGKVPVWTTIAGTQTKANGEVSFIPTNNLIAKTEFQWKIVANNPTYGTSDSSTTYQFRFRTP